MRRRRRAISRGGSGGLMSLITGEPSGRARGHAIRRRSRGPLSNVHFEVESHIAREIFAVIYLAVSFLVMLSIYGQLGAVGEALHAMLLPVFGVGIHLIPIVFFGMSLTLFFSKKSPFTLARITGLVLLFTSILSILHLSVPPDDMLVAAQNGQYGGYIGFIPNFFFRSALQIGNLGSSI